MKRFVITLLLIFTFTIFSRPAFAENTTPEPYNMEEFPQSLKDLRRFEIISLGALPFVTLDVTLAYSFINWYKDPVKSETGPNIFAGNSFSQEEQVKILKTSLFISCGVGITDFGYRLTKRLIDKHKTKIENKSVLIIPLEEDPDAIKIENPYQNQTDNEVEEVAEEE